MRAILRRIVLLGAVVLAAGAVGTAASRAGSPLDPTTGLIDVGHQLTGLEHQVARLQANGQTTKAGTLAGQAVCGLGPPTQVFLPWSDSDAYALAPGGNIASTSGWSLRDVAAAASHDPYSGSAGSLVFANGDSEAVTPAMCVNLDDPTLRFFLDDQGGSGSSSLEVSVVFTDPQGNERSLSLARLTPGASWQPSPAIPIAVGFLATASASGTTPVAFDFRVHGLQRGETLSVDGIFVDPRMGV